MQRLGTGMAPATGMRTAMGTAAGGGAGGFGAVRDGKATEQIYSLIRDGKHMEAITILTTKQLEFPSSRAAASLLAYCYYYVSDFQSALQCYERLMKMCPDVEAYKFYYAQALFKAGMYEPALKACQAVDGPDFQERVLMLQVAIKYEQDDFMNTKSLIDSLPPDDADTLVNSACVMYKEASAQGADPTLYEKARLLFQEAMSKMGFQAELACAHAAHRARGAHAQRAARPILSWATAAAACVRPLTARGRSVFVLQTPWASATTSRSSMAPPSS
jgi:tetratricopeptide repeat protein 30